MAIGDFAISDRAISAPEDTATVVVFAVGRAVLRDRPANSATLEDGPAGAAELIDLAINSAALSDARAGSVAANDTLAGVAILESFPL